MTGNTFYFGWEVWLQEWIQAHMGSFGATLGSIFTMLGEELFLILILGYIYWCYDKELGKILGTNITAAVAWNPMIKGIFLRRRPYFDNEGIKCLRAVEKDADIYDVAEQGFSFPSGHSMNSATVFGSIAVVKRKRALTVIAFVIPFLVGISRVMLGVHYVTDVLVGWTVGIAITFGMTKLESVVKKKWVLHLILFLFTLIGCFYVRTSDYYTAVGIMGGFFLAYHFEEKFVNFKNTKSIPKTIARILVGLVIYLVLNTGLKLPFSKEFLSSGTFLAFLVRTLRYMVVVFVMLGVYPMAFDKIKFGKNSGKVPASEDKE